MDIQIPINVEMRGTGIVLTKEEAEARKRERGQVKFDPFFGDPIPANNPHKPE